MKDRIATKPGRVLVTPEDGSPSFYATLTMADEPTQEGDAPTKSNLLTDETANLLSLAEDATVNDALQALFINGEWKVLADVTVDEEVGAISISLTQDLSNFSEFFVVGSTLGKNKTFSFRIYVGKDINGTHVGNATVHGTNDFVGYYGSSVIPILKIESGSIFISSEITYDYNGGKIAEGTANELYFLGYGTQTNKFVSGSRIMIVAR